MAPKAKEDLVSKELEFDTEGISIKDGNDPIFSRIYPTGSLGLDVLIEGFTSGEIQLWGPDGIGKTSLAFIMGGEFQAANNYDKCRVYVHATEGRYNPRLVTMAPKLKMFAKTEKLANGEPRPIFRISMPKSGEKMFDFIQRTLQQDEIKFFHIIDSVDNIKCEANEGKPMSEDDKLAATATLLTRFLRNATVYMNHYGHIVLFIHQIRDKISTGAGRPGGVRHAGGNMANHNSNLRLGFAKLWSELYINEKPSDPKSKIIGHMMDTKIEKVNTSGNSLSGIRIPFIYNMGIDRVREILSLGLGYGLIERKGAWFARNGENIGQGENGTLDFLRNNANITAEIEQQIKETSGLCKTTQKTEVKEAKEPKEKK